MGDIKDSICRVPDTPYDGTLCYSVCLWFHKFVLFQSLKLLES